MEEKVHRSWWRFWNIPKKTELAALQDDLTVQSHSFITYMDRWLSKGIWSGRIFFKKRICPRSMDINCSMGKVIPKIGINCCGFLLPWEWTWRKCSVHWHYMECRGYILKNGEMLFSSLLSMRGFPLWIRSIAGCGNMEKQNWPEAQIKTP